MRMTKDQINAKARKKRADWKLEIQKLHKIREEKTLHSQQKLSNSASALEAKGRSEELVDTVYQKLCSSEFKAWYEATTGEIVDDFLSDVVISSSEYYSRFPPATFNLTQMEWVQARIELIALKNPWTNPEKKKEWGELVQASKNPKERRAILLRLATPRWADQNKIVAIYMERERLSCETGIPHDVDHVIPIVSQLVCGLHCEFNLRVVPAHENRSKSNRFDNS